MQLITDLDDLFALDGHRIVAFLEQVEREQIMRPAGHLICTCGWAWDSEDTTPQTLVPDLDVTVPPVLTMLSNMADAGRDHLVDVLRQSS